MRTRLSPLLPIVVAVAALGAQGAQSDPDPQQPTFRAGVNVVRVDVIATDRRGTPITDLTRDDFEILENGTPQAIEQFRLVDVDGNPGAGDPPPPNIGERACYKSTKVESDSPCSRWTTSCRGAGRSMSTGGCSHSPTPT